MSESFEKDEIFALQLLIELWKFWQNLNLQVMIFRTFSFFGKCSYSFVVIWCFIPTVFPKNQFHVSGNFPKAFFVLNSIFQIKNSDAFKNTLHQAALIFGGRQYLFFLTYLQKTGILTKFISLWSKIINFFF